MKKILILAAIAMMTMTANAQQPMPVPMDEAVRYGVLENGLTYYIRHNEYPKQRCEFHIAQAVGATLEEDNQNGLAHFLEHMCFNGTEHFPGKQIIEYFESVGVDFGGNINAYTSLDQTVYRLSDVPTIREGILDSALLVLHDWSCAVSLLAEEIDAERGVIREEWRTGNTANRRAYTAAMKIMFPGTRYATRDVIGDTAVINNFSYDALRDYYHKWYGPDLQAIVVVGDIDVDRMEQKIKALWANVPARANRGERPYVQVPDNEEPIVGIYTDPEGQRTLIQLMCKHETLPAELQQTNMGWMFWMCNNLISHIMDERMQQYLTMADSPLGGARIAYENQLPTMDGMEVYAIAKEGQETKALLTILTEVEKMRRYGFTEDEVERAKTAMMNDIEKRYNEREATPNMNYVHQYIQNYLQHYAAPSLEWEKQCAEMVLPMITAQALNPMAAQYLTEKNIVLAITAPAKPEVVLPSEEVIREMLAAMPQMEIAAPETKALDSNLVKKAPKAAKIKKVSANEALGTTEWTLSNGVRVVLKPTDYKHDEVLLEAYSAGGKSLLDVADLPSAELATDVVEFMGLGEYSMSDLQKVLSGKTVSTQLRIGNYSETISAESSVKDLETMLQLIYLSFTAPRRDEEAYKGLIALLENQLRNRDTNPKMIFRDSVQMMASDHSERTVLANMDMLQKVSLDRCMAVYKDRFSNPADFTFVLVGNIDPKDAELQRLICTYLGGIRAKGKAENYRDNGVRAPKGIAKNYFGRTMTTHTASNRIQYTSYDIPYSLENELTYTVIGNILGRRYLESIREREGGSYGVATYAYQTPYPVASTVLLMQFDTDPEKQEKLMQIIHAEVQEIVNNGPRPDDLQKDKESMLKSHKEDVEKNDWWAETIIDYLRTGQNAYTDYEKTVDAITAEKVQTMLRKLTESGNVFEVVMYPQDAE